MATLQEVRESNFALKKSYGPGLVAVFVGGTSGIGEATARAFVKHTLSPHVYLVGRNEPQASRIIEELRATNPDAKLGFIKCDASLLKQVDETCSEIKKNEEKINLLFLSPGMLTTKGRDETEEGLDKKLNLHYYSRMRFIVNFMPELTKAAAGSQSKGDHGNQPGSPAGSLSRVVSVLAPRTEGPLILDDLPLKSHYSLRNCANHAVTMNSLVMEELASMYPLTSFIHANPGVVKTNIMREFSGVTQWAVNALTVLAKPWVVPLAESGERHLYAATSARFTPWAASSKSGALSATGPVEGNGAYLLYWDQSPCGNQKLLQKYRSNGTGKLIWRHTLDLFDKVCGKQQLPEQESPTP